MRGGVPWLAVLLVGLTAPALAKSRGARVFAELPGDHEAVPVACFRSGTGWRSGSACLDWLPREGPVRTLAGGSGRILGPVARVKCNDYDPGRRGLRVEVPDSSHAILWSADPAARFEWMTGTQDPPPPPREALAALYRLVGSRLGMEPGVFGLDLDSRHELDLDGDGTKDALLHMVASVGQTRRAGLTAAVLSGGSPRVVPLSFTEVPEGSESVSSLYVAAAMDLDADGVPELWVQEETPAARVGRLLRLRGARFEELARRECPFHPPGQPPRDEDSEANACTREHRDRLEPNNAPAQATAPKLSGGPGELSPSIQYDLGLHAGDVDWFRVRVPAYGGVSAFLSAESMDARLVPRFFAEDGATPLAGTVPGQGSLDWANLTASPRTVLLRVSRQGQGCAMYRLSLSSGESPQPRLLARVRRMPLPTEEQRARSPQPDREAELLALTLSPGFIAVPEDVARISRDLAAIRDAEPELRDVRYNAPYDGRHLEVFFVNPAAALQGVYSAWEPLNAAFGVKAVKPGPAGGLELEFGPVLNLSRVGVLYQGLPGVFEVSTPGIIDGSTVRVCREGAVFTYILDVGSGDCPSGCMQRLWHVFRVARPNSAPERLGMAVPGARPEPDWMTRLQRSCPAEEPLPPPSGRGVEVGF